MIDYSKYTVEEFATDEHFRQWILDPSEETVVFWDNWIKQNPDKQSTINQAIELLLTVYERYKDDLTDEQVEQDISLLVELAEAQIGNSRLSIFINPLLKIAAVLVLISGLSWFFYSQNLRDKNVAMVNVEMITKTNHADNEMTVLLSDGSVATLMKGGSLRFPNKFEGESRKVYLKGEAFFDVAKNPAKPFLVFANETVTKVLGTSFLIKAVDTESTVMVVVKTGKVSVYPEKDYATLSEKNDREVAGVILSPNQQVVFNRKDSRLEKGIVENPDMLILSTTSQELVFDDQPVAEVLRTLGEMYGIEIVFDKETLAGCPISTIFKEETLKQRMNAICQAIGATYEVVDGQIIINSKGCLR
ncbi:FecR domain-containing protein [Dyadobacter sp. CY345]|uniref:FecR family protein n=1 Tax=Dyadobacter sp. CY345 TaxID=2909335 RepID=UPI001F3B25DD|nr:FecR domain-containing protein [Dyadobacter sp. CY345]MCF2446452.1 FecR domain-containing protein [Dyadobacter sp. CY345]